MTFHFNMKGKEVKRASRYKMSRVDGGAPWKVYVRSGPGWEWVGDCIKEETARLAIGLVSRDRRTA